MWLLQLGAATGVTLATDTDTMRDVSSDEVHEQYFDSNCFPDCGSNTELPAAVTSQDAQGMAPESLRTARKRRLAAPALVQFPRPDLQSQWRTHRAQPTPSPPERFLAGRFLLASLPSIQSAL